MEAFANIKIKQLYKSFLSNDIWKNSFYILISQSVFVLIFFLSDIVLARTLTKSAFAEWKQLLLILNLGVPILSFGFPEGFKYFFASENQSKDHHFKLVFTALMLNTIVLFLICVFFGSQLLNFFFPQSEISSVALLLPFLFFSFTVNKILRYVAINDGQTKYLVPGAIASLIIGIILMTAIGFIYKTYTSWYLPFAAIMIFLIYIISIVNIFFRLPYKFSFALSSVQFKKYLTIGFPLYIASFIGIIVVNIDKAIVSGKDTLENFAVYSVGALEIPIFSMISASVSQSYFPKMVALIKEGNKAAAKKIWINTTVKISYITYPVILCLMIVAPRIITTFFGEQYKEAIPIFKTYLLVALWRNNYYGAIISSSGQTKWITFYSALNLIINGALALLLYKSYGIYGVAFSAFIACSFINILQMMHEKLLVPHLKNVFGNWKVCLLTCTILLFYFLNL